MTKPNRPSVNCGKAPQNRNGPVWPKATIDLALVEELGVLHATDQEIVAWFDARGITVQRRDLVSKKFRRAVDRGRSRGRVMLRRLQFEAAQCHHPGMLILLGEEWLGQPHPVDVSEGVPAKSFMPAWLEKMLRRDNREAVCQSPDDPAGGNNGVQDSTVEE